jgi:hypothetical protein
MKAMKIDENKAGCRFAIVCADAGFKVYRECCNYASHVRGGIAKTWRLVETCASLESAEMLFQRKISGKQKP